MFGLNYFQFKVKNNNQQPANQTNEINKIKRNEKKK